MRDDLRKNPDNILSPNLIPVSDPYRTAPYNIMFNHVNNPITEVVNANLFADQASIENDVVDWVFLELRNTPLGNNIIGTRSALVQRDGDVVDLDGVSPIYFKDVAPANNYTLVVKHRNHLGISTMTETVTASLTAPPLVDFTTMTDAEIFGPANAFEVALDGKNMSVAGDDDSVLPDVLWGTAKYSGASNDRVPILSKLNNNPNGNLEGYFREDLTMNRFVKYSGAGNDRVFLLSEVLKNLANSQRKQSIP
jgi:hypothetical protein